MGLDLDVAEHNGWAVVSATGEIDMATAPRLRERLVGLMGDGHHQLVVDLDGVEFLDSTGLGVLVGALRRVRTHDGELALVCTQSRILKGFEITGLDKAFPIHASIAEAVGAA